MARAKRTLERPKRLHPHGSLDVPIAEAARSIEVDVAALSDPDGRYALCG